MVKRKLSAEKYTKLYLYVTWHLLVFVVSLRQKRLILGRSVESRTPLEDFLKLFFNVSF